MQIEISEENFSFLKDFMRKVNTQDNRCTSKPYYYVVQCKKEIAVPEGTSGTTKYFDNNQVSTYTFDELKKYWCEEWTELEKDVKDMTEEENDEFQEYVDLNCTKFDVDYIDVDENVFFTEQGYKDHIKMNGHNFRHYKSYRSYVKHAFRNPEIKGLFKALEEITSKEENKSRES